MKKFISEIYDDSYNELTVQYHTDINDLDMQKRSIEGIVKEYNLSLKPVVPLPEFDTRELHLNSGVKSIQFLDEENVVIHLEDEIVTVNLDTGNVVDTVDCEYSNHYYLFKRVIFGSNRYEETDTDIRILGRRTYSEFFFARDKEGRVCLYKEKSYLLSHNIPYSYEDIRYGNYCIRILRNLYTEEKTAFFLTLGFKECFQYRGHWYQYGGNYTERKLYHCDSREELPCDWSGAYVFVHGDCIILWGSPFVNVVRILRPRRG